MPGALTITVYQSKKNARNLKLIQELLKGQRVDVKVTPMFIFLFRDGTVLDLSRHIVLMNTCNRHSC